MHTFLFLTVQREGPFRYENIINSEIQFTDYADCIDFFLSSFFSWLERLRWNNAGTDGRMQVRIVWYRSSNVLMKVRGCCDEGPRMLQCRFSDALIQVPGCANLRDGNTIGERRSTGHKTTKVVNFMKLQFESTKKVLFKMPRSAVLRWIFQIAFYQVREKCYNIVLLLFVTNYLIRSIINHCSNCPTILSVLSPTSSCMSVLSIPSHMPLKHQ